MANFFKGLLRANMTLYGDVDGVADTRLSLSVEKGKCIAWAVGTDDVELSRDNVASVSLLSSNQIATDLASGGGKKYMVNVYNIEMKNGKKGIMRLLVATEYKVLSLIK